MQGLGFELRTPQKNIYMRKYIYHVFVLSYHYILLRIDGTSIDSYIFATSLLNFIFKYKMFLKN